MRKQKLILIVIGLILTACAQQSVSTGPGPVMERYLEARVAADEDTLRSLACSTWEAQASLEAQSFRAANAELQEMRCYENGTTGDLTVVTCDGKLLTTYDGETRERALGSYMMSQEDGEWKMCGEAAG